MKRTIPLIAILAAFHLFPATGQSGTEDWVSGGGELVKNRHNPWFVRNTRNVSFCLTIDEANFGQTEEFAREKIQQAIDYWKIAFKNTDNNRAKIASQHFNEESCSDNTDLKFQLGALSKEQMAYVRTPKRFLGLTVRTDYDEKTLRGKGFVYIAPAFGDLRPELYELMENPWNDQRQLNLLNVIAHEMGHVFGMPHAPLAHHFMNNSHLEKIVKNGGQAYLPGATFWGAPLSLSTIVYENEVTFKFFAMPLPEQCIEFEFQKAKMLVYSRECGNPDVRTFLGTFQAEQSTEVLRPFNAVKIVTTAVQEVFAKNEFDPELPNLILGPQHSLVTQKGKYVSREGSIVRQMFITRKPWGLMPAMGGVINGKLYVDFSSNL